MRGTRYILVGLAFVALSMIGVIMLITDVLFATPTVVAVTAGVAVGFTVLWYGIPFAHKIDLDEEPHP